jgi:hypothetical protein
LVLKQKRLDAQIKGFSYFFIVLIAATSLFGLIGSAILWQKDRVESKANSQRQPTQFEIEIVS